MKRIVSFIVGMLFCLTTTMTAQANEDKNASVKMPNVRSHVILPEGISMEDYILAFAELGIPFEEWDELYKKIEDLKQQEYESDDAVSPLAATCKSKWVSYYGCQKVYDTNEGDYDYRIIDKASREGYNYITDIDYYPLSPQATAVLSFYGWNLTQGYWRDSVNFYPWYIIGDDAMLYFFWNNCYAAGTQIGVKITICK